ncbi:BTB/POZ domain-containing protein 17 [Alosa pseudoharengus]|uniref:BTB/POZ domain-containing protein 17 n=1 Tax=Alosa pseudoharengus TaxID=34774 RepID=UPI003F8CD5A5
MSGEVVTAGEGLPDVIIINGNGNGNGNGVAFGIDHSVGLVLRLAELFEQGNGSDVTLRLEAAGAADVREIQAHRLVLALQSSVFQEMLENCTAGGAAGGSDTLVITESAESVAVFDKFIRYLYCGEIAVRVDQATTLHRLATKYNVTVLRQGLSQYMSENLAGDPPRSGRAVSWYEYAKRSGDEALRDSCLQYLTWNLSSVLRSREWPSVSAPLLLTLLQRSDLVLQSELELFEAVETWLARQKPDGMTAENALRSIRYAMMAPRELFQLQRESRALRRYGESVRDLLYMSYQFHSASPLQLAKFFDVNCSLFTPRNYLASAWGAPWVIGNPARDDRSASFQTQLGPSGHDAGKRVTWNALFSPRWLPLSLRPAFGEQGSMQPPPRPDVGRPRVIVTPATSSADMAGVSFQKTLLVVMRRQGKMVVRHVYNFHQSTEEIGDFLAGTDLQRRSSEYLTNGSLHLHIIVKPLYQSLIAPKQ